LDLKLEGSHFKMVPASVTNSIYAHWLRKTGLFSVFGLTKHCEK